MKLPVIKSLVEFIEKNDEDYILESLDVLEHLAGAKGLKEEEIEVIGELLSNMYGSLEVKKLMKEGQSQKEALNAFMGRVLGAIGR